MPRPAEVVEAGHLHDRCAEPGQSQLLVALVALAAQGASPALAKRGFFGVHYGAGKIEKRNLNLMDKGGVGTVRKVLYWNSIEIQKGKFAWATTDALVGNLASRGISMLPVVYGSPHYVAKQPNIPPVGSAHKRKLFRQFLAQAVKRYGKGGTYWKAPKLYRRQHPGKRPRPIENWQIWNEPNLAKFFAPRPSVHKYATLVRSARRAIHSADHKANVILAGMSGRGHPSDKKFLNRFYRQRRIKRSFDAVAVNPYAPSVTGSGRRSSGSAG